MASEKIPTLVNVWAQKDAEKYLRSLCGDMEAVTPETLEAILIKLEASSLSCKERTSFAALAQYVGVAFLNEDNPMKAHEILKRSLKYYDEMMGDKNYVHTRRVEAGAFLKLSSIRNYNDMCSVSFFYFQVLMQHNQGIYRLTPSTLALMFLGIEEIKSRHIKETTANLEYFNIDARELLKMTGKQNIAQNRPSIRKLAAFQDILRDIPDLKPNDYSAVCSKKGYLDEKCSKYSLTESERLQVVKMLMRRPFRNTYPHLLFEECNTLISKSCRKRKDKNNCSMANLYFAYGYYAALERGTLNPNENAEQLFSDCFRIRRLKLGENHVETVRAKFYLGYLQFLKSLSGIQLPVSEDYKLMKEAFACLKLHSNGELYENFFFVDLFTSLLSFNGVFQICVDLMEEYINSLKKSSFDMIEPLSTFVDNEQIGFFTAALAAIYMSYKLWQRALELFRSVRDEQKHSNAVLYCICASGSAYCLFKLDDHFAARTILESSQELHYEILQAGEILWYLDYILVRCEFDFFVEKNVQRAKASLSMGLLNPILHPRFLIRLGFLFEVVENSMVEAEKHYLEGLKLFHEQKKFHHPFICDGTLGLARVYLQQKKLLESEKYATKSLKMAISLFGCHDKRIEPAIDIFKQLLKCRRDMRKAERAFRLYMDNFALMGLMEESELVASFVHNFALKLYNVVNLSKEEIRKCTDLFARSFHTLEKSVERKDDRVVESRKMLGLCHLKLGNVGIAEWHLFNVAIARQNWNGAIL